MHASLKQLLTHAGPALAAPCIDEPPEELRRLPCGHELIELLEFRNGFLAFDDAFCLRPLRSATPPRGIAEWNNPDLWRRMYDIDMTDWVFFASDLFSIQFALSPAGIFTFDPESTEVVPIAKSLAGWAEWLLSDPDLNTGRSFAWKWARERGPLQPGQRLMPKQLFMLGGGFQVENLDAVDEASHLRVLGPIANALAKIPDGTSVRFTVGGESP
ncbi:MAG: SMI1/KNR4 family protein [Phycisphaerales bacterium]|nr:SMI1/KNR4 family protein [Phycisphaerales bacterium]